MTTKESSCVAHSMGGLIARCMLQKIALATAEPKTGREAFRMAAHGGIVSGNGCHPVEQAAGPAGSVFALHKMIGYLSPDHEYGYVATKMTAGIRNESMRLTPQRLLLVGTDPRTTAYRRRLCRNARPVPYVTANCGWHRERVQVMSSSADGEVNVLEEGSNLGIPFRALRCVDCGFGSKPAAQDDGDSVIWQLEVRLAVRGLSVVLSEQLTEQQNPIRLNDELQKLQDTAEHPVPTGDDLSVGSEHAPARPSDRRGGEHGPPSRHIQVQPSSTHAEAKATTPILRL